MIRNTRGGCIFKVYAPHLSPAAAEEFRLALEHAAARLDGSLHVHVSTQSVKPRLDTSDTCCAPSRWRGELRGR
jgi:hypothetical protein